jgi:hypothetical protein
MKFDLPITRQQLVDFSGNLLYMLTSKMEDGSRRIDRCEGDLSKTICILKALDLSEEAVERIVTLFRQSEWLSDCEVLNEFVRGYLSNDISVQCVDGDANDPPKED